MRQASRLLPTLDFLHPQYLDTVGLARELERQILLRIAGNDRLAGRLGGGDFHACGPQLRTAEGLPSTRSSVASNWSGLNGFTIQPVAPACLPCILRSGLDSVVNSSSGVR